MKLFCFSYAGGSAAVYLKWKKIMDSSIEIVPVELPGRGKRFSERLCYDMNEVVRDVYSKLEKNFINEDYMFYGHSMGSWIVYYLTNEIIKQGGRVPRRLFLSGKEAPHIKKNLQVYHEMNDDEFINKIYELGGTPKEIIENKDLLDIYIPILKNDYKLIETCQYEKPIKKYDFDITIFNGRDDDINQNDVYGWKEYTSKQFKVYNFEGGHFFINYHEKEMLDIIYRQSKKDL